MSKKKSNKTVKVAEPKTYNEHAHAMTKAERKTCAIQAGKKFTEAQEASFKILDLEIKMLNNLREAGIQFNIASGREQLVFSLEGKEFCRKEIIPFLPKGMDLKTIQSCCAIAKSIPEPIKTREQLKSVKKEMQMAFLELGLIEASQPRELQNAHAKNLFNEFVNKFAAVDVLMKQLETEEPMEKWPQTKLDEFIENAQPVKSRIERAEKIRLGFK